MSSCVFPIIPICYYCCLCNKNKTNKIFKLLTLCNKITIVKTVQWWCCLFFLLHVNNTWIGNLNRYCIKIFLTFPCSVNLALDLTGRPLWHAVWCPWPILKQEIAGEGQEMNLMGCLLSQASPLSYVSHLWSMCFLSTGLAFSWWLQINGPSYPMWEDHKVLYGYMGVG